MAPGVEVLGGIEEPACSLDGFVSELPGYHRRQAQDGKQKQKNQKQILVSRQRQHDARQAGWVDIAETTPATCSYAMSAKAEDTPKEPRDVIGRCATYFPTSRR